MQRRIGLNRSVLVMLLVLLCVPTVCGGARRATSQPRRADDAPSSNTQKPSYTTGRLRGRVVWLAEALKRRYNIDSDADASAWLVALETPEGKLHPIIKDVRGRGFLTDARLRNVDMELAFRRYAGSPMIQVTGVYTLKEEHRYEVDYWCDICAIPMFELKQCECCQGPTRIRERKVDPASGEVTGEEPPEDRRLDRSD